jgi:hypothetical protein
MSEDEITDFLSTDISQLSLKELSNRRATIDDCQRNLLIDRTELFAQFLQAYIDASKRINEILELRCTFN